VNEIALTPLQLRAARELLHWSRDRLAARMGIGFTTIARFENEGLFSISFDPRKARETLEAAGVEFVDDNDCGAGVRLTRGPK
jgi:transcriptional regulator with XRE-family HTH domain